MLEHSYFMDYDEEHPPSANFITSGVEICNSSSKVHPWELLEEDPSLEESVEEPAQVMNYIIDSISNKYAELFNSIVEFKNFSIFFVGAYSGNKYLIEYSLNNGVNVDSIRSSGDTALIIACMYGNANIVGVLLSNNCSKDIQNKEGYTALMYACINGYEYIAQLLLSQGVDVNIQNNEGYTALMYAAESGCPKLLRSLINAGANLEIKDTDDETALIKAIYSDDKNIVDLLLKNKANFNIKIKIHDLMMYVIYYHPNLINTLVYYGVDFPYFYYKISCLSNNVSCMSYIKSISEMRDMMLKGYASKTAFQQYLSISSSPNIRDNFIRSSIECYELMNRKIVSINKDDNMMRINDYIDNINYVRAYVVASLLNFSDDCCYTIAQYLDMKDISILLQTHKNKKNNKFSKYEWVYKKMFTNVKNKY